MPTEHHEPTILKLASIVRILGSYSIKAAELKQLLGRLRQTQRALPVYYPYLLKSLVDMAQPTICPSTFCYLDGIESGKIKI